MSIEGLDSLIEELERRVRDLEDGIRSNTKFIQDANKSGWNDPDETITDCCDDLINLADNKPSIKRY